MASTKSEEDTSWEAFLHGAVVDAREKGVGAIDGAIEECNGVQMQVMRNNGDDRNEPRRQPEANEMEDVSKKQKLATTPEPVGASTAWRSGKVVAAAASLSKGDQDSSDSSEREVENDDDDEAEDYRCEAAQGDAPSSALLLEKHQANVELRYTQGQRKLELIHDHFNMFRYEDFKNAERDLAMACAAWQDLGAKRKWRKKWEKHTGSALSWAILIAQGVMARRQKEWCVDDEECRDCWYVYNVEERLREFAGARFFCQSEDASATMGGPKGAGLAKGVVRRDRCDSLGPAKALMKKANCLHNLLISSRLPGLPKVVRSLGRPSLHEFNVTEATRRHQHAAKKWAARNRPKEQQQTKSANPDNESDEEFLRELEYAMSPSK